jgi:nucleoside-diphosphate-sugar epimerase
VVVLVTGAAGFLGRHAVRALSWAGHGVRAFDLPGTPPPEEADSAAEGDIRDAEACRVACRGADAVLHLAARVNDFGPREAFWEANVQGTRNLLMAASEASVRRLVFVSSVTVHAFPQYGAHEDAPRDRRAFPYGESKRAAEELCEEFQRQGRLETVIVRPGVFPFGPGDRRSTFRLLERLARGRAVLCARGRGVTTTAYAENLAHGLALAVAHRAAAGRTYLIDDGEPLTWFDLFDRFTDALSVRAPRYGPPLWAALAGAWCSETWARLRGRDDPTLTRYRVRLVATDFYFRSERAREELGYEPKVPFPEAISRTVAWFRSQIGTA